MLNFIKKFTNKKENISTATMTTEEYMRAVEGGIIPSWADNVLMEKTGIKNLFAENAKIVNAMSYDDTYDCLKRASKMINMAEYVIDTFNARARELNLSSADAFTQHIYDVESGKKSGAFSVSHEFFSANTIRDLFIEAQAKAEVTRVDVPKDLDDAVSRLNDIIKTLPHVKLMTFHALACCAITELTVLTGFRDE